MRLLLLLYVLLLFNLTLEKIPSGLPARDWWWFDDNVYKLTPEWYWKEILNKVTIFVAFFIVAYESRLFRNELFSFAWLQFFDWIDYILTNNTPWFHIGILPISMNILSTTIFGFLIFMAWIRTRELS